ncbi:MAG: sugar nucleotide-binding protein [Candidatus Omnitrophica bacterium]|nr:sugar nucleotide-binding protein [Candidatus Omnitrophota bacterium]
MSITLALPKTAIIGATGFLGGYFLSEHRKIHSDCIGTCENPDEVGFSYFDLAYPEIEPLKLFESFYQEALIFAGLSGISICEKERELARKINVEGVVNLIRKLVDRNIKPIYFSSDMVFDGISGLYDENFPPNPLNEYGRQKAEIEQKIKEICSGKEYLIVRLSKVFALNKGDGTLLDEMASALYSGKIIQTAYDQIFCPTLVLDVVNAVLKLQMKNVTGVVNVGSSEIWSRHDLALALADQMNISRDKIKKISLDDLKEPFIRPRNTSLNTDRLKREISYKSTPIMQCIQTVAENWKGHK